jgi:hypothetical protein
VVSENVFDELGNGAKAFDSVDLGPQVLRGLSTPLRLIQLIPKDLPSRSFPPLRLDHQSDPDQGGLETSSATGSTNNTSETRSNKYAVETNAFDSLLEAHARKWKPSSIADASYKLNLHYFFLSTLLGTLGAKKRDEFVALAQTKWKVSRQGKDSLESKLLNIVARVAPAAELKHSKKQNTDVFLSSTRDFNSSLPSPSHGASSPMQPLPVSLATTDEAEIKTNEFKDF